MSKYPNSFRKCVEEIMFRKGWTQRDLAEKLGVTPPSLSRTLSVSNPSYETLEKLSEIFQTPPFYFLMSHGDREKWDHLMAKNSNYSPQELPKEQDSSLYKEKLIRKVLDLAETECRFVLEDILGRGTSTPEERLNLATRLVEESRRGRVKKAR